MHLVTPQWNHFSWMYFTSGSSHLQIYPASFNLKLLVHQYVPPLRVSWRPASRLCHSNLASSYTDLPFRKFYGMHLVWARHRWGEGVIKVYVTVVHPKMKYCVLEERLSQWLHLRKDHGKCCKKNKLHQEWEGRKTDIQKQTLYSPGLRLYSTSVLLGEQINN